MMFFSKNRFWRFFSLFSLCFILALATGCKNNAKKESKKPPKIVKEVKFKTLWKANSGLGLGDVQMNLAPNFVDIGGKPYIAASDYRGTVTVIDPETGKRLWRKRLKKTPLSSAMGETPEALVVGSSKGDVIALDKKDGRVLWRTTVSSEVLAAPRGNKEYVVVQTIDSQVHGLDMSTGKSVWTYQAAAPNLLLRGASSPLILQNEFALLGFANGQVGLFKIKDGQLIVSRAIARPHGRNELERMIDINGSMGIRGSTVYIVTYQGKLVALDLQTMEYRWSNDMSSYVGLVVAGDRLILADSDDRIYAINANTGEVLWKQDALENKYVVTPAVWENYVIVGDAYGYVYALALDTGRLLGAEHLFGSAIRMPLLSDEEGVMAQAHTGRITKFEVQLKRKNNE